LHDRVAIEIGEAASTDAASVRAGTIYRPVRERDPKQIVDTIIDGIERAATTKRV